MRYTALAVLSVLLVASFVVVLQPPVPASAALGVLPRPLSATAPALRSHPTSSLPSSSVHRGSLALLGVSSFSGMASRSTAAVGQSTAPEPSSSGPLAAGGQNFVKVLSGFDGSGFLAAGGYTPPDVQVAAGPTYLVEMVNLLATVYTRGGVLVYSIDLPSFFLAPSDSMTDPRVYYDAGSGRWFASISDVDTNEVNIAVSETGDPTGSWFVYAFTSSASPDYFADQPSLGVSSDKVVVSANMFDSSSNFVGTEIWALNRTEMILGGDTEYVDVGPDITFYSVYPASNGGGSNLYMASVDPSVSGSFTLFTVSGDPSGDVSFTNVTLPIADFNPPNGSIQRGTPVLIDSGDGRIVSAAYSGSKLWFAFSDFAVPAGDTQPQDGFRLVEVDTSSSTVLQDFDVNVAHTSYFYPALAVDGAGNLIVLFGASSSTIYPGLMVTAQRSSDPLNTFEVPEQVFNGTGRQTQQRDSITRYGDYFGAATDPTDPTVVWVAGQFGTGGDNWATHIMATQIAVGFTTLSVSFAVSGGGTGYAAPILTYVYNNATLTASVTSSPQAFNVDNGSLWSVSAQLPGSTSAERWVALQSTSGTIQSSLTVAAIYDHEYNVSFTAQVEGNLSGAGAPAVTFTLLGHPSSISLAQSAGSSTGISFQAWSWVSAGSAYSYDNPLPGSNATLRWVSLNPSGVVSANTAISVSYLPQSAYTIYATPSLIPGPVQGAFSAVQNGTSTTPAIPTQPTTFWLDLGSAWSVSASTITVNPGTRLIYSGPSSGVVGPATTVVLAFQTEYFLTIVGGSGSAGFVSPDSGWYAQGTQINLSATANTGWEAAGWIGAGDASFSGSAPSGSFLLNAPVSEVASFIPGLTITAAQGGSVSYTYGSVQGSVSEGTAKTLYVPANSTVSLFAKASSSLSEFTGWSGDTQGSSSTAVLSMTAPKSVEATFGTSPLLLLGAAAVVLALALVAVLLLRRRAAPQRPSVAEMPPSAQA